LAFQDDFQGVGIGLIEISQQMLTKVNSAGMCVAKHQPHVLHGYGQIYQALFCEPYQVLHLCEIYIKPRLFIRPLHIFKRAHETTSLSWFFCVMTKEQEKKRIQNHKFFPQHIKILFSHECGCAIYE